MSQKFEAFWESWPGGPRKVNKKGCLQKWTQKKLDQHADAIIWHVEWSLKNNPQWKGGFIPMPSTYLTQERWNDGTFQAEQKKKFGPAPTQQTDKPDLPELSRYRIWWHKAMLAYAYGGRGGRALLHPMGPELLQHCLAKRDELCGMAERDGDWADEDFVSVGLKAIEELFGIRKREAA